METVATAGGRALVRPNVFRSFPQLRSFCLPRTRTFSRRPAIARAPLACTYQDSAVLDAAWVILEEFNRNDMKSLRQPSLEGPDGVFALRASLVAVVDASRAQEGCLPLLGICANSSKEALKTLQHWTAALSCDFYMPQVLGSNHDLNKLSGPVYIKYNAHVKASYLKAYTGKFRGVIVQIGQKQVGHLPLALFG